MNIKKGLMIGLATLGLSLSANASPINVGGVIWDPSASNEQFLTSLFERVVFNIGENVEGIGRVSDLNAQGGQSVFCPDCELTYEFGGFELVQQDNASIPGLSGFVFTGGWVNFYVDNGLNWNENDRKTATDGNLWLTLNGHTNDLIVPGFFGSTAQTGTLFGNASGFGTGSDDGDGTGLLDVGIGQGSDNPELGNVGIANGNFNTNTRSDNLGGFADILFTSTFAPINSGPTADGFQLVGGAVLFTDSIPEPTSIALLGLGLLGFAARRKQKS